MGNIMEIESINDQINMQEKTQEYRKRLYSKKNKKVLAILCSLGYTKRAVT